MALRCRKLIEVALPLDAINKATARAVLFAQMVDDPSDRPPLTADPENLEFIPILETFSRGRLVFTISAEPASWQPAGQVARSGWRRARRASCRVNAVRRGR